MAKADTPASGDVLELRDDGTVVVGWDQTSITLRRPKVGEWLSFIEESETAIAWTRAEKDGQTPSLRELVGPNGPFLTLHRRVLLELGGTTLERDDLPIWMASGDMIAKLSSHWLRAPLDPSERTGAAATP